MFSSLDSYQSSTWFYAILAGGPGQGKSCSSLSLLEGMRGATVSKLAIISCDKDGLSGLKLQAAKRNLLDRITFCDLEMPAMGADQINGKMVFYESLIKAIQEATEEAKRGNLGTHPGLWIASLTSAGEAFIREARYERPPYTDMDPDKWGSVNIMHGNLRLNLAQFPGHRVLECHLEKPPPPLIETKDTKPKEPSLELNPRQASAYPRAVSQLIELVVEPGIPSLKREERRVFETRCNSAWTRKVRRGNELLDPQEPADWSVLAHKLEMKMFQKKES